MSSTAYSSKSTLMPDHPSSEMVLQDPYSQTSSSMMNQLQANSYQKLKKLRIIKPFEEKQLLNFYCNTLLEENENFIQNFYDRFYVRNKNHNKFYDLILSLDKSVERFQDVRKDLDSFLEQISESEGKCWQRTEHIYHHSNQCGDGQLVKAKHQYERYNLDVEHSTNTLDRLYYLLRERLINEHVVHSYFQKYFQLRFELTIYEASDIIKRLEKKFMTNQPSNLNLQSSCSVTTINDDSTINCSSSIFDQDETTTSQVYIDPAYRLLKEQLLDLLSALFIYYSQTMNYDKKLKIHCYQAIVHLCRKFLSKLATYHDRLFLLNQILRCPPGSSKEFGPVLEPLNPMPFKSVNHYDLGKQYVDYGVTIIATILSPIIQKEKHYSKTSNRNKLFQGEHPSQNNPPIANVMNNKESWLLIDTDLEDEELIDSSTADLTENDIITYLSRVPFREILQFMSLVTNFHEKNNDISIVDDESGLNLINSSTENAMIRLFAFNTRLIQIFRNGLQNFNCLRYKKLTLYIASMIKEIIKTISDNWKWCKEKFTTKDQALLIRLQVEFDHFMLRSIMAILSTNRRGVWPLLAKIDFEGISEPMLWHILWVVYNNGRNEQNEMTNGLCPYMSANYWKDKFRNHVQWKFIFIEKLSILSLEEASGLLDFFYNMAMSRSFTNEVINMIESSDGKEVTISNSSDIHQNDDFLREIIERFAEICLLKKFSTIQQPSGDVISSNQKVLMLNNQEFYSTKGVACLIKLLSCFKSMLIVLLQFIQSIENESNLLIQPCFDLFTSIIIDDWKPDSKFLAILYKWLSDRPCKHIYNRFARILLTKIGWNRVFLQNDHCLLVPIQQQQTFALKLYQTMEKHIKMVSGDTKNGSSIKYPIIKPKQLSDERLEMAQSDDFNQFGCWCWSMLLSLRLHPLDLIPDESCWDDIIYGLESQNDAKYVLKQKHWTMQQLLKFNYDTEMTTIARGIEIDNPYAIYIGSMISDLLFDVNSNKIDLKKLIELNEKLACNGHFIPMLQILYHFLPFCFKNYELQLHNSLIDSILTLLQGCMDEELISIILLQRKHFHQDKYSQHVSQAWTEILFESINRCLNFQSTSWLSSLIPQFLLSSSSSNVIDSILSKITSIFDRLAMEMLLENNETLRLYLHYLTSKLYGRMVNWKLTQLDSISSIPANSSSGSSLSTSWLSYWYSNESTITYLSEKSLVKSPWMTPFHLLLRHCLNLKKTWSSNGNHQLQPPVYLAFLLTEVDIRRTYHIWNHLTMELNKKKGILNENEPVDSSLIETELLNASQMFEKATLPAQLLPINLLTVYILKFVPIEQNQLKIDYPHPLIPLFWRQFFSTYFLYTDSLSTIGNRFIDTTRLKKLNSCLNVLFDYHNQRWIQLNNEYSNIDLDSLDSKITQNIDVEPTNQSDSISAILFEDRLVKLYRAYRIWLKDNRFLQYADLDDDQFSKPEFQIKLLNSIVSNGKVNLNSQFQSIENLWPEFDHINSFFFLNYLYKSPLKSAIFKHEQYWLRLMKIGSVEKFENKDDEDNNVPQLPDSLDEIQFMDDKNYIKLESTNVEFTSSDQFGQIIDYFTKLTSTLNCNILLLENDIVYNINSDDDLDSTFKKSIQDISVVFVIMRQIVDNVVEEARFVENQLEEYSMLNTTFQKDILPKLYHDVSRNYFQKISCDRAEFDASCCTRPAMIKFEYVESILNHYIKKKYDLNRSKLKPIITSLICDIPGQKVVASIYFIQKICLYLLRFFENDNSKTEFNQKRIHQLFETMSGWINSINTIKIKYHLTEQLLDIFLDMLQKLSNKYMDEVNYFYLNTALKRSISLTITQQLAPCLTPNKTSPLMFIEMYKLIGSCLNLSSSQQTIFVLLSKFDVARWLQMYHLTDKERLDLLNCLFQCISFFGTNPCDEFLVTYDLYRKHLQDVILYRFPIFMPHIISYMLQGMTDAVLAPGLWNSILHTFGFYTKSLSFVTKYRQQVPSEKEQNNEDCNKKLSDNKSNDSSVIDFDFQTFDNDLRSFLLRQKLFTSHELYDLLQTMIEFNQNLQQNLNAEFLEHFKIYNVKFLQFLTFISYCWINSNTIEPLDDHSLIWLPFFENWKFWIFPKQNTKFIQLEHFRFTWQLFINCVQFMLDSFYDGQSQILSCLWQPFMNFILETRSVERTDVEMFESKLLQLNNWSQFYPSMIDMKLMYESVLMSRYSVERLNSFLISNIKWNQVLLYSSLISMENAMEILENLTYTIISLVDQPYIGRLDFHSIPFMLLHCDKVKKIVLTLLEVMKRRISVDVIKNASLSSTTNTKFEPDLTNRLLVIMRLLKALVLLNTYEQNPDNNILNQDSNSQRSSKIVYYTHCIGTFVSYITNQNVDYIAKNPDSIRIFLKDSIDSLRPTIDDFESQDRVMIFSELLQSINEIYEAPIRDQLATHFITIFSYMTSNQLFAEIIFAVGKIIYSIKTSIYLLESLIENYFNFSGDLSYLVNNLEIVHLDKHLTNSGSNHNNQQHQNNTDSNRDNIEDFIMEAIKTRSFLLLLIYIHRRLRHRTVPDICTRKYVYSIIALCAQHFKFGGSNSVLNNCNLFDEPKMCFFWARLFDLLTFDHSSISGELNISIYHLSSLKTTSTKTVSPIPSTHSLLESPIIYSQIALSSASSNNKYQPTSSTSLSSSLINISNPSELLLNIHNEDISNAIQTLMLLCWSLNNSISDSMNRGFFGLFRQQKPPSHCCLFLLQSIVLHGACTMLETFFPEFYMDTFIEIGHQETEKVPSSISLPSKNDQTPIDTVQNKLKSDLNELIRSSKNRLHGWKKNKSLQEFTVSMEEIFNLTKPLVVDLRNIPQQKLVNTNDANTLNNETNIDKDVLHIGDFVAPTSLLLLDEEEDEYEKFIEPHPSMPDQYIISIKSKELLIKQRLWYYIRLTQHQQKRFHTIQRWLLKFYNEHNYMKHFV